MRLFGIHPCSTVIHEIGCWTSTITNKKCGVCIHVYKIYTHLSPGEEFSAVFLSTTEPTDEHGDPYDPVRSISNELVFNTIMTRARSLIYCVGNPFILCELGDKYKVNCWSAYLQRCVQCETLQFALPNVRGNKDRVEAAAKEIQNQVFPHTVIDEATAVHLTTDADNIIKQYIRTLKGRREYRIGCTLVRNPQGDVDWKEDEEIHEDNVILCHLDYSFFHQAKAVPLDQSQSATVIKGKENLKGALPGDTVRVDTKTNSVLFDEKTEEAIRRTHFGSSFLCRVSEHNCIQFYPLDKCYPKFANLPTITREEKMGVVCFDPSSINSTPRVCNVFPHQVALKLTFVVKFLGWKKERGYPLGIIVGALPSQSSHVQQLLYKMRHNIPLTIIEHPIETLKCEVIQSSQSKHFTHAITIDPEGSKDHDDALTCTFKMTDMRKVYSVGVHITNLNAYVRKGSQVDLQAQRRGCTVYNAPDSISSPMFPANVLEQARIDTGKTVDAFTVLTDFTVVDEGLETESISLGDIREMESKITSQAELTYAEAQALLIGDDRDYPQSLAGKISSYNSCSPALHLKQMTQHLWKFAWYLRTKRLKEAALAYTVREKDELLYLEAHYLVEEFMIWANHRVARRLCKDFKNQTIVRSQKPPDVEELEQFKKSFQHVLPLSAACKPLIQNSSATVSNLVMLQLEHSRLREHLMKKSARDVMHCVQVEHLHPQLAVLDSNLRSLQSTAEYCVLQPDDQDGGSHSSLQCQYYTHFTSPLRRYVDVVVHRQLHAALHKQPNMYTAEELNDVCITTQKKQKQAKMYERDILSLKLVNSLKENQHEYNCVVSQVNPKLGMVSFCFTDVHLRLSQKNSEITTQQLHKNHCTARDPARSESTIPYTWKVKLCSLNGTPASFLDPDEVEVSSTSNEHGQLTFYCRDDYDCLVRKDVNVKVNSKVRNIPPQTWLQLQDCTMKGEDSVRANCDAILRNITTQSVQSSQPIPHTGWRSALCIYKMSKDISLFDVMKVQLCATQGKSMQEPAIQLLEVGPGLKVCIHHNRDATKCFVGKLIGRVSKEAYNKLTDYVKCWEPVILAEVACASVKDSEFLFIRDAQLTWPNFQLCTNSAGHSYYKMTDSAEMDKCGVKLILPKEFMQISYRFFNISKGDLACIRYNSNDGTTKYVFHMVVNHVEMDEDNYDKSSADVYMKFIMDDSNYISQQVHGAIVHRSGSYEIQLIPTSLPLRYSLQ